MPMWDKLQNRELEMMRSKAPENVFDELIQWTEEGKIWNFPIDNEQGTLRYNHLI